MAGKFENTIIVYTSDHGDMIGSHGLNQKGFAMHYDEVLRVPLIIRDPDSKANIHIDKLISLLDIIPTLADLTGIKITNETHGKSFASYFTNPDAENIRDYIIAETFKFADTDLGSGFEGGQGEYIDLSSFNPEKNAYNFSIRARDEKYIFHWKDTDEFYDLNVDPFENCNLYENLGSSAKSVGEISGNYLGSA
ncbi:Ulvan-active sulfatase [subsurface metagenome]